MSKQLDLAAIEKIKSECQNYANLTSDYKDSLSKIHSQIMNTQAPSPPPAKRAKIKINETGVQ